MVVKTNDHWGRSMRAMKSEAMTPLIGLMVAIALFSGSFYYVVETAMKTPQETSRAEESNLSSVSIMIADAVMGKGTGWFTGLPCSGSNEDTTHLTPDKVGAMAGDLPTGRFGLGSENCQASYVDVGTTNQFSFNKFDNVVNALDVSQSPTNNLADYPEARRSLGLTGTQIDFHLRTWPVLESIRQVMQGGGLDPNLKPLYIGDYAGAGGKVPQASVVAEIRYIDTIAGDFDPNVYHNTFNHATVPFAAIGDVMPDDKNYLGPDLEPKLKSGGLWSLEKYTTVIVGSNVDHNQMTPDSIKNSLRDWVRIAGGTLIVLGHAEDSGPINWLNPFLKVKEDPVDDPTAVPDPAAPVLNVPNQLDALAYLRQREWGYQQAADSALFTHVVSSGADGDILAISKPGTQGKGKVILTAWRPYALVPNQATVCPPAPAVLDENCPSLAVVQNLITITYRTLFLDYGPDVPRDQTAVSAVRVGSLFHPELNKVVNIQMQVFVFRGGS